METKLNAEHCKKSTLVQLYINLELSVVHQSQWPTCYTQMTHLHYEANEAELKNLKILLL